MADYTVDQLFAKLERADAAGDTEAAHVIADEIRRLQSAKPDFSNVRGGSSSTEAYSDTDYKVRAQRAEDEERYNPTKNMSGGQRFAAGFGKSFADILPGIRQAAVDTANRGNSLAWSALGRLGMEGAQDSFARNIALPIHQMKQGVQGEVDERGQLDRALMDTGAGFSGNVGGSLSQLLIPGGAALRYTSGAGKAGHLANALGPRGMQAANIVRGATLPTTVAGMTGQGALLGYIQPVETGESRTLNVGAGAAGGAIGGAIPKGLGALYRAARGQLGRATTNEAERRAAKVILAEAENPALLMRPQPSAIPGVQRTLAEETLDSGIARLERNARSTGRGFDILDRTNNSARNAAIRSFAGDPQQIAQAEASRDAVTSPLLKLAQKATGADTSRLVSQIDRAQKLFEGRPAVQQTLTEVKDLLFRNATDAEKAASANWPDRVLRDEVGQLYNVRKTLGDLMSGKLSSEKPFAQAATRELMAIREGLDRVMRKASPEFGQYLDQYKAASKDINRMEIGQELLGRRTGSAILDPVTGDQVLTPAAFSGAARDLDRVAASATGFRKAKAADILRPEDMATISGVQDDLQRRAFAATAGSGGNSQTFERLALNDRMAGGMAARLPVVGKLVEYLGQIGETRLQAKLGEMLADPSKARAILAGLPARDRRVVEQAMSRVGGSLGASSPSFVEIVPAEQQILQSSTGY